MRHDDDSLRFLLSGGHLSGEAHQKIVARVVPSRVAGLRFWRPAVAATLAVGIAAAVPALVVAVRHDSAAEVWRVAKGSAPARALNARCLGRPPGICGPGDRMVFEADGGRQPGVLAAYVEGPTGIRRWYFPAADGHLASVPAQQGTVLAREVGKVGDDWPPGSYAIHLFLLARPTDRTTLLAGKAAVRATAVVTVSVVP